MSDKNTEELSKKKLARQTRRNLKLGRHKTYHWRLVKPDGKINAKGGLTAVLNEDYNTIGFSTCSLKDGFNKKSGRAIAIVRSGTDSENNVSLTDLNKNSLDDIVREHFMEVLSHPKREADLRDFKKGKFTIESVISLKKKK